MDGGDHLGLDLGSKDSEHFITVPVLDRIQICTCTTSNTPAELRFFLPLVS